MDSPTPAYAALIEYQIQRARIRRAPRADQELLPTTSRPVTNCIAGLYKKIMLSVRDNAYDNLNKRAFASKYRNCSPCQAFRRRLLRGVSNDDASRKRDGDLRLDFTDDSIAAKRYRAAMCALLRRRESVRRRRRRRTPAALRLLDAALRPPPPTSLEATRSFCTDHLVRSIRTRTTPSSFGATVASFSR